jgi:polysaccharide pyruvyl transferase CsaB
MESRKRRIVISGYFGFGNYGDEAILAGTVGALRRRLPDAEIVVLSCDPGATAASLDVLASPRWPFAEVRSALRGTDLLISGGGGVLHDSTSRRSLGYYLQVIRDGVKAGAKTMVFSQGIGPLRRWGSRRLVRSVLDAVDAITVRDQASRDLVESLGVAKPPIRVCADAAFLLPEAQAPPGEAGVGGTICACVRRSKGGRAVLAELAAGLSQATEALKMRVRLVPFQPGDADVLGVLAGLMSQPADISRHTDFRAALEEIGSAAVVVGMRLHALVFSVIKGIPSVAVSYDPKVKGFADDAGIRACFEVGRLRADDLRAAIVEAVEASREIRSRLLASRARLVERARLSVEMAASLLGR